MAVTGLVLIGFLLMHMYGNLKMFLGEDAFNHYAEWLKGHEDAHPLPADSRTAGSSGSSARCMLAAIVLHMYSACDLWGACDGSQPVRLRGQAAAGADLLGAHHALGWRHPGRRSWSSTCCSSPCTATLVDGDYRATYADSPYKMVVGEFSLWWMVLIYARLDGRGLHAHPARRLERLHDPRRQHQRQGPRSAQRLRLGRRPPALHRLHDHAGGRSLRMDLTDDHDQLRDQTALPGADYFTRSAPRSPTPRRLPARSSRSGPTRKFEAKLVNPSNRRKLTVIIVGTGLAGGAAAASLGEAGYNVLNFCYQDSPRRAHSIAAQGGINAAKNYRNDNDSTFRLFYDTVKGGDYRARETNVYRLAEVSANIIDQCVAQGVPFAREYGGLLDNRSFGGVQVQRTFYARGQTGQQLLIGAYQALERQVAAGTVQMHTRHEMLELIVVDGRARGIVTRDMVTGSDRELDGRRRRAGHRRLRQRVLPVHQRHGLQRDRRLAGAPQGRLLRQPLLHADPPDLHPGAR